MSYDIFFISYQEPNCEENWQRLLSLHPTAKRVHGIKGIDRAHMRCKELSTTDRFWTVDGDNWVTSPLEYTDQEMLDNYDLLMFNAADAIDGQPSSLGGVKLWCRDKFINTDMSKGDFSTNATANRRAIQIILSEHRYNSTPFETWKFTFRHMVKCYSGIIRVEVLDRNIFKFEQHKDLDNGINNAQWSYRGLVDAKEYVDSCQGDFDKINLINNYDWLQNYAK